MKILARLLVSILLCSACSYIIPPRKVACCEKKAPCCFEQMCCLPRYAKAAGAEPKAFTPEVPVYSSAEGLDPLPGQTIDKSRWFDRFNPFKGSEEKRTSSSQTPTDTAKKSADNDGFWGNLWPF